MNQTTMIITICLLLAACSDSHSVPGDPANGADQSRSAEKQNTETNAGAGASGAGGSNSESGETDAGMGATGAQDAGATKGGTGTGSVPPASSFNDPGPNSDVMRAPTPTLTELCADDVPRILLGWDPEPQCVGQACGDECDPCLDDLDGHPSCASVPEDVDGHACDINRICMPYRIE